MAGDKEAAGIGRPTEQSALTLQDVIGSLTVLADATSSGGLENVRRNLRAYIKLKGLTVTDLGEVYVNILASAKGRDQIQRLIKAGVMMSPLFSPQRVDLKVTIEMAERLDRALVQYHGKLNPEALAMINLVEVYKDLLPVSKKHQGVWKGYIEECLASGETPGQIRSRLGMLHVDLNPLNEFLPSTPAAVSSGRDRAKPPFR